ncbi:hypothetical protein OS493_026900, partial [Desmophyllum pertusum]
KRFRSTKDVVDFLKTEKTSDCSFAANCGESRSQEDSNETDEDYRPDTEEEAGIVQCI